MLSTLRPWTTTGGSRKRAHRCFGTGRRASVMGEVWVSMLKTTAGAGRPDGLWEYQLHPITVGSLREALTSSVDDGPVPPGPSPLTGATAKPKSTPNSRPSGEAGGHPSPGQPAAARQHLQRSRSFAKPGKRPTGSEARISHLKRDYWLVAHLRRRHRRHPGVVPVGCSPTTPKAATRWVKLGPWAHTKGRPRLH